MIGLGTSSGVAHVAAALQNTEPEELKPCPFCEGPPVSIVIKGIAGGTFTDSELEAEEDGLYARSYVFCHECGAHGPPVDGSVINRAECDDLERQAINLWQNRDARHRSLYDGSRDSAAERMAELGLTPNSAQVETDYLLSSPANAAHLASSIEQARNGEMQARELIDPDVDSEGGEV